MRHGRFRVRFAPQKPFAEGPSRSESEELTPPACLIAFHAPDRHRSRSGCLECKRRRVKCDETYPICLRCQKRGDLCRSGSRKPRWQLELPFFANMSLSHRSGSSLFHLAHTNERLLRHWFENTSHIMVLDPEKNPLSYSATEYLFKSPSLVHILQSISAAHEHFFEPLKLTPSLEERGKALALFQNELSHEKKPFIYNFLTIILLGLSASWLDQSKSEFGKEHLLAAQGMVEQLISENDSIHPLSHYVIGKYIYWDMVCSFLVHPDEQNPITSPAIHSYVSKTKDMFHPTMGYSLETFYHLASVGRYYRSLVEFGERDPYLEATLEELLLREVASKQTDPNLHWLEDGFRKIGLITLYRIQVQYLSNSELTTTNIIELLLSRDVEDLEQTILDYARLTIDDLSATPITSPYLNLQAVQLLMAGAELTASDEGRRSEVRQRYRALFSLNRLPVNLWALQLLEELWTCRDRGDSITWLELMVLNGWRLMLG